MGFCKNGRAAALGLGFLLAMAAAAAQQSLEIERLQVDFWPEYDRPSMLIIYRGRLAARTPLPATLSLAMPGRVESPLAVAYADEKGLYTADHTVTRSGEETIVTFTVGTPEFQLEYYDQLEIADAARNYRFAASVRYPVRRLILQLLQPPGTTGVTAAPPLAESGRGTDGLPYSWLERLDLAAGEPLALELRYSRSSDSLTVERPPTPAAAPLLPPASPVGSGSPLVLILVAALVAVFAFAIVAAIRYARGPRSRAAAAQGSSQTVPRPASGPFCPQCGDPVGRGDRYCRHCGAALEAG